MARKIQNYLCVDVRTEMENENMKQGEKRLVYATLDQPRSDGDIHFTLKEMTPVTATSHPELKWRLMDRSKHGKVCMNSRHVKVEFYIHHEEYENGANLADLLSQEIESLGENMCETDYKEEVHKCC